MVKPNQVGLGSNLCHPMSANMALENPAFIDIDNFPLKPSFRRDVPLLRSPKDPDAKKQTHHTAKFAGSMF